MSILLKEKVEAMKLLYEQFFKKEIPVYYPIVSIVSISLSYFFENRNGRQIILTYSYIIQRISPKKTGFRSNNLRHCAYIIYSVKTQLKKKSYIHIYRIFVTAWICCEPELSIIKEGHIF